MRVRVARVRVCNNLSKAHNSIFSFICFQRILHNFSYPRTHKQTILHFSFSHTHTHSWWAVWRWSRNTKTNMVDFVKPNYRQFYCDLTKFDLKTINFCQVDTESECVMQWEDTSKVDKSFDHSMDVILFINLPLLSLPCSLISGGALSFSHISSFHGALIGQFGA